MKKISKFVINFLFLIQIFHQCPLVDGKIKNKNILVLCPFASKSHKNVFEPIIVALASKGHQVTLVSSYPRLDFDGPSNPNVTEIVAGDFQKFIQQIGNPFMWREGGMAASFKISLQPILESCDKLYQNSDFMKLLDSKFDLIFVESFLHDCLLGFIYKLSHDSKNAPFVIMAALPAPSFTTKLTGNRLPPSFVPAYLVDFGDKMTFMQRTLNVLSSLSLEIYWYFFSRQSTAIYRHYLGSHLPSVWEINQNVSMIMTNSHFTTNVPRPTLPDVLEIGGVHCRPANPLPKDLENFCSGSGTNGVILFSLGSIVQSQMMPDWVRQIFLNVFSRLPQRIIWKWESGKMEGKVPSNIKLVEWLPQQDLLGHEKIKLFITHAGLLSSQEALYHEVPMLGIPIFADQDMNINRVVKMGYALRIEILNITEQVLENSIKTILQTPRFLGQVKKFSKMYRDQQTTPISRAVYWSEYLMRYNGAKHIRSASRNLNFFQYYCIDVIVVVILCIVGYLWILKLIIKKLMGFARGLKREQKISLKKKSN